MFTQQNGSTIAQKRKSTELMSRVGLGNRICSPGQLLT
jgi:hypothetical protein